jgi:hypothetical protein
MASATPQPGSAPPSPVNVQGLLGEHALSVVHTLELTVLRPLCVVVPW